MTNFFLFYNNGTSLDKLFSVTTFSSTNGVNPSLPINAGASDAIWSSTLAITNKQNQPIYSSWPYATGTSLSHLESSYQRCCSSPGYSPNYVMTGTVSKHQLKREYTLQEVSMLQTMGYTINSSYTGFPNINNHTPYHSGNLITAFIGGPTGYMNTTPASGLADLTISTTNGNPVTLNLSTGVVTNGSTSQNLNFIDADSDPITVYEPHPGWKGLYNLRGCGNGNNSNQLNINASRDIITFTPRNNFIGRAQFAFHLYDGKQRGDYVVFTIDVSKGSTFVNSPSNELIINGNFEEGTEVRELGVNEFNTVVDEIDIKPNYLINAPAADGVQIMSYGWNDVFIRNSSKPCLFVGNCFDNCAGTAGSGLLPVSNIGDRWMHFSSGSLTERFSMTLIEPILPCSYQLEADLYVNSVPSASSTVSFHFHNQGINSYAVNVVAPILADVNYSLTPANVGTWTHITLPFTYTSTTGAPFFEVDAPNYFGSVMLDNISLTRTGTSPTLTFSPSALLLCAGNSSTISVSGASSYTWNTGANTSSIVVGPSVTTTYTVTGTSSSGCMRTGVVSVTVAPNPTLTVNSPTICSGSVASLSVTGASSYTWSTGSTGSVLNITPTVTTVYTVTGRNALTNCSSTNTVSVFVNPAPSGTLTPNGSISLCGSQTITLNATSDTDPNATYAWNYNGTGVGSGHNINVSLAGNYQVVITNTLTNCSSTFSTPVYVAPTYVCDQCLVPNGDFEYYATLTGNIGNITDAPFWNSPTNGSPDYFNTASSGTITTIPNNTFATSISDHTGNITQGYLGFINYASASADFREYAQTPLNCALEPNQKYNVSMWARAANDCKFNTKNVGIHFSNTQITGSNNLFSFAPQLNISTVIPSTSWTQLTGTLTGSSASYITIGNFYNDAAATPTLVNSGATYAIAYYFIDDVSVTPAPPSYTASSSSCIIPGSAVTLTLSGSPGYYVTNGVTTQTLNAATGTIAVSPTVTTTYTINPILVCNKCNVYSTITVSVSPSVTLSASSTTLCSGNSTTLTASGATTYSWSTGATTNSISVSPVTTTIYTVTGTTGGCTNTKTVSVTVNTTPTVAINNATICSGTSTVLTASGATTYSWSTGATTNTISVSPTSTTNYTVTGINAGCTNTKTVSVTVTPNPTVTVNSATICSGQTTTLTAAGATTYSWNTSATTNSISVSPTSTTNYTVTGTTNGCSNTKTTTVTVNPSPTVTAVANPTSICVGQTATLTAGGATTYSWNTGATTTTISVSPSVTTVYTVTGTAASCSSIKTVTIIVGPVTPTITASASSVAVCSGGSATLTAAGASNYTWTPGGINTSTAVVTPTAAIIYTLTGSYGIGCNTATTTLLVNPIISTLCCSAATSTVGTSLTSTVYPAGGTYTTSTAIVYVQGVVNFTANTSYTGYTFRMAPGALIRVDPNQTLTLTNCKLYSCSELWDGILLREDNLNFGNLVLNNTTIEDMYNGIVVDYDNNRVNSATPSGSITINNSTLNKNYISVQMKNSPGMSSGGGTYPFSMTTSTISTATSTTSPGSSLKPSSTYTYAYNQITNGSTGSSAPYLNFPRSFTGIQLYNLGYESSVNIGSRNSSTLTNTFNNLDFGINGTEVYSKVYNNYFKSITGSIKSIDPDFLNPLPPAQGPDEIGIAIAITQTTTANQNSCIVGANPSIPTNTNSPYPDGNLFEDCNKGVKSTNNRYVTVLGNVFTTTVTTIPVSTGSVVAMLPNTYYFYQGQAAVWSSALGTKADLSYNFIRNHSTGIYDSHSINPTVSGTVIVQGNDIAAPASTGYCMQAIQIDQAGGTNIPTDQANVYNNLLTNVYRGVVSNGVMSGLLVKNNTINVEGVAKTLNYQASQQRTGVALTNCYYASVKGNSLTQNGSTPTTTTTALAINGVYLKNSPYGKTECNSTTALGRCFVFEGTCDNSWKVNAMSNSYTGLEIRVLGRIGPQGALSGSPGNPNLSANTWTTITRHTNILSSAGNNTISPLYVLNGATTTPTLNFGTTGHTYTINPLQGIRTQTAGTSYTCNAGSAQRLAGGNNTGNSSNMRTAGVEDSLANYTSLANSDESTYDVFTDEFMYQNKQLVFKLIDADSLNVADGSTLDNFYQVNQNTAIDQLTQVQEAIAADDINAANSANASVSPSNAVEYKHQRANELVLKYLTDRFYTYTAEEKQDLYSYANECIIKGYYVVQARNIINIITNQIMSYNDDCEAEANAQRKAKVQTNGGSSTATFNLFPNPNNGTMQLDYNLGGYAKAEFRLFDITGKLISTKNITENEGSLMINEQNLNNGMYFYHILVGEKNIKTDKIVIIK